MHRPDPYRAEVMTIIIIILIAIGIVMAVLSALLIWVVLMIDNNDSPFAPIPEKPIWHGKKICDYPDHCTFSDCPTAFCDRGIKNICEGTSETAYYIKPK